MVWQAANGIPIKCPDVSCSHASATLRLKKPFRCNQNVDHGEHGGGRGATAVKASAPSKQAVAMTGILVLDFDKPKGRRACQSCHTRRCKARNGELSPSA